MDIKTKEQRSYNMSQIRSENTKPEKVMFSLLKQSGYNFKRHYNILGKPDIVFSEYKLAVFINGEFWHGKDYKSIKNNLPKFWIKKIGQNIKRDKFIQNKLHKDGWHIINFWGKNIVRNPEKSINRLIRYLDKINAYDHCQK